MAIKPIDLQVLFTKIQQVSKEQSEQKDALSHQQALQANETAKKTEHSSHSVNKTEDLSEGPDKIKDEKKKKENKHDSETGKEKAEDEKADKDFFRDPDLGHNIDISG